MFLTNAKLRNLKPAPKIYRKPDGQCLYIEVPPRGAKRWRYRYRFAGKPKQRNCSGPSLSAEPSVCEFVVHDESNEHRFPG